MGEQERRARAAGYEAPADPDKVEVMSKVAALVDHAINPNMDSGERPNGFILMVFPFNRSAEHGNAGARMNYISNANRDDVIACLEDQLHRFKDLKDQAKKAN